MGQQLRMGCQECWRFSCLISAFLQLFISFILLSCSALLFFTAKFFSFFGISLPCQHSLCFHTLLSQHHNPNHHHHNHVVVVDDDDDHDALILLKQSLEREQSARAALCAELDQERIAAATAADEAMAMISRLQEERASLQIQARQYQRILEEKSAYDAEEMAILKDIIVTRETQIHFLEKQIQEYTTGFQENQDQDTKEYYDIMEKPPPPTSIDKGKESPESYSIVHDADEAAQEIQERGFLDTDQDQGPLVHDVHICDSSDSHEVEASSNYGGINKSSSDMAERFSSLSTSPSASLFSQHRQTSLSWVDQERLKIDAEIGCLRARLRTVQKEKEKLKSSLQSQEHGKTELRLLENIADLLREIRHLREPEKIARQASLPPLSSKETSKRRRSRSTCVGVGQSSSS